MRRGKAEKKKQTKNKRGYPPTADASQYEIVMYPNWFHIIASIKNLR